jgi:hypothetical protein
VTNPRPLTLASHRFVPRTEAAEKDARFMESLNAIDPQQLLPHHRKPFSGDRALADRGSAALSRSVELARRIRSRGYVRARLDCRGGSPPGSRPSADLGRVIARDPIPFTGGKEAPENRRSRSAPANPPNGTTAAGRAIRAPWTIPALGTVCVHHPLVGGRPSLRAARPVFSSLCSKRREWQDLT